MKTLLIDNWMIEKAINNYSKTSLPLELKRIMCFMVLWDEVCYVDNQFSSWWKECVASCEELRFLNSLKPLPEDKECEEEATDLYENLYKGKVSSVIGQGALEYSIYAEMNDIHYAPVDERAKFLSVHESNGVAFSRNEIVDFLDKNLLDYYKKSAEKIQQANIKLGIETLFHMIGDARNSCNVDEQIRCVKKKPMIKAFRKWVDGFENDIREGRELIIDDYLSQLEELERISAGMDATLDMGIFPTIGIGLNFPLIKGIKRLLPRFYFPCFLYRKGLKNAKDIILPHRKIQKKDD